MDKKLSGSSPASITNNQADVLFAAFSRGDRSETRLTLRSYKKSRFADLRIYFRSEQSELSGHRASARRSSATICRSSQTRLDKLSAGLRRKTPAMRRIAYLGRALGARSLADGEDAA